VFVLAKETGWDLQKILWEIPICLVNQAEHVFMFINGVKLRRVEAITGDDLRDIKDILGI
jgi:hypothetical protein